MSRIKDITGNKYGRLTVIEFSYMKGTKSYWKCKCDCGNECIVRKDCLNRKDNRGVKSCGCLNNEKRKESGENILKKYRFKKKNNLPGELSHSNRKSPYFRFYDIFCGMRDRCNNPNNVAYKYYGEKGIKVEWLSYEDFFNDMYESYIEHVKLYGEKETTIDRIDSNKSYCKDNCKWATYKEQANNKRYNYKGGDSSC